MPKPYRKNPRKITQKQLENLETTLAELGDLSGIVHDLNTDEIIGGNQRSKVFRLEECEIVLTEEYAQADEQGTVGLGFVVWRGKRYAYRAVRWDERTAEKANIVANRAGGEWDFEMLATEFSAPDLVAWGFEPGEIGMENEGEPIDFERFFEKVNEDHDAKQGMEKIVLEYTTEDAEAVKAVFKERGGTPESIVWELLGV